MYGAIFERSNNDIHKKRDPKKTGIKINAFSLTANMAPFPHNNLDGRKIHKTFTTENYALFGSKVLSRHIKRIQNQDVSNLRKICKLSKLRVFRKQQRAPKRILIPQRVRTGRRNTLLDVAEFLHVNKGFRAGHKCFASNVSLQLASAKQKMKSRDCISDKSSLLRQQEIKPILWFSLTPELRPLEVEVRIHQLCVFENETYDLLKAYTMTLCEISRRKQLPLLAVW